MGHIEAIEVMGSVARLYSLVTIKCHLKRTHHSFEKSAVQQRFQYATDRQVA